MFSTVPFFPCCCFSSLTNNFVFHKHVYFASVLVSGSLQVIFVYCVFRSIHGGIDARNDLQGPGSLSLEVNSILADDSPLPTIRVAVSNLNVYY